MSGTAVFTVISNNYSSYAATLMESLRNTNPSWERYICIVDRDSTSSSVPEICELANVVNAEDIGIHEFADMAFRYDVMEMNTAVKPFMFKWLLEHRGYDRAIYLDPDIFVFRPLDEVNTLLDTGSSAVLTPHLLKPLEDGRRPDDHDILKSGVYNLGFAAMSNQQEALDFVSWWSRRLQFQCYSDLSSNLFTDQRWCDFAPSFMPNLAILRHPGYNVAYWNLAQRSIERGDGGEFTINGAPLIFFHFSGLRYDDPKLVSKHQDRFTWADLGEGRALFSDYRAKLIEHGWGASTGTPYSYDHVDGLKLAGPIRGLYRKRYPKNAPADVEMDAAFVVRMCNQPVQLKAAPAGLVVTDLMMHLYESRPDLQAAFILESSDGVKRFVRWFEDTPIREYGLDPRLTRQSLIGAEQLAPLKDAARDPIPNEGRSYGYRLWRKARKRLLGLGVR